MTASRDLSSFFDHDTLALHPLGSSDIPLLVHVINEAYSYQDAVKGTQRTNIEHLTKRASEVDFYVLAEGTEIVGCVYLEPRVEVLHFGLLTLAPRLRGRGIGSLLLKAIDDFAIANRFSSIGLDYMSLAPWLKRYYERFGFNETGEIIHWGKIDLIEMKKSLIS